MIGDTAGKAPAERRGVGAEIYRVNTTLLSCPLNLLCPFFELGMALHCLVLQKEKKKKKIEKRGKASASRLSAGCDFL